MTEDYITQRDLDMARQALYDRLDEFDDEMTRAAFQQGGEFMYRYVTRGDYDPDEIEPDPDDSTDND